MLIMLMYQGTRGNARDLLRADELRDYQGITVVPG